jgi:hypothetical protein
VDGSGGFVVPDEFEGSIFLNGFFLGCAGILYDGIDVSGVVFESVDAVLLALLVSVEFDVPEPEADCD